MAGMVFALSSGRKLIVLALMLSAGPSWKTDFPSHFRYALFPPLIRRMQFCRMGNRLECSYIELN
jgi:hypothetical protein